MTSAADLRCPDGSCDAWRLGGAPLVSFQLCPLNGQQQRVYIADQVVTIYLIRVIRGGAPLKRRFEAIAMIATDGHEVKLAFKGAGSHPRRVLAPSPLAARRLGRFATSDSRI